MGNPRGRCGVLTCPLGVSGVGERVEWFTGVVSLRLLAEIPIANRDRADNQIRTWGVGDHCSRQHRRCSHPAASSGSHTLRAGGERLPHSKAIPVWHHPPLLSPVRQRALLTRCAPPRLSPQREPRGQRRRHRSRRIPGVPGARWSGTARGEQRSRTMWRSYNTT